MSDWDKGYWTGNGYGSLDGALGAAASRSDNQMAGDAANTPSYSSSGRNSSLEWGEVLALIALCAVGFVYFKAYDSVVANYAPNFLSDHHVAITVLAGIVFAAFSLYPPILIANVTAAFFFLSLAKSEEIPVNALAIALTAGVVAFSMSATNGYLEREHRKKRLLNRIRKASLAASIPTPVFLVLQLVLSAIVVFWLLIILAPSTLIIPAPLLVFVCCLAFLAALTAPFSTRFAHLYGLVGRHAFGPPPRGARLAYAGGVLTIFLLPYVFSPSIPGAELFDIMLNGKESAQIGRPAAKAALPSGWLLLYAPAVLAPIFALPRLRGFFSVATQYVLSALAIMFGAVCLWLLWPTQREDKKLSEASFQNHIAERQSTTDIARYR